MKIPCQFCNEMKPSVFSLQWKCGFLSISLIVVRKTIFKGLFFLFLFLASGYLPEIGVLVIGVTP